MHQHTHVLPELLEYISCLKKISDNLVESIPGDERKKIIAHITTYFLLPYRQLSQ